MHVGYSIEPTDSLTLIQRAVGLGVRARKDPAHPRSIHWVRESTGIPRWALKGTVTFQGAAARQVVYDDSEFSQNSKRRHSGQATGPRYGMSTTAIAPRRSAHAGRATQPGTSLARGKQSVASRRRLVAMVAMLSAFPANADELVDRADANGDGYVSLYELRAAYYADMEFNRRIERSFAEYDTDGDGLISEAERRARGTAGAETASGAGIAATASGGAAMAPATGTAPATAAGTASTSAAATEATTAAEVLPGPAAELSAATGAEMASTPGAETASVETPATGAVADSSDVGSPEGAPATGTADEAPPDTRGLSRSELWIRQIDADNSGGASKKELAASGDGNQWLSDSDFRAADKNGDGDLGPDELEVLIQSMERRQRR